MLIRPLGHAQDIVPTLGDTLTLLDINSWFVQADTPGHRAHSGHCSEPVLQLDMNMLRFVQLYALGTSCLFWALR